MAAAKVSRREVFVCRNCRNCRNCRACNVVETRPRDNRRRSRVNYRWRASFSTSGVRHAARQKTRTPVCLPPPPRSIDRGTFIVYSTLHRSHNGLDRCEFTRRSVNTRSPGTFRLSFGEERRPISFTFCFFRVPRFSRYSNDRSGLTEKSELLLDIFFFISRLPSGVTPRQKSNPREYSVIR